MTTNLSMQYLEEGYQLISVFEREIYEVVQTGRNCIRISRQIRKYVGMPCESH